MHALFCLQAARQGLVEEDPNYLPALTILNEFLFGVFRSLVCACVAIMSEATAFVPWMNTQYIR